MMLGFKGNGRKADLEVGMRWGRLSVLEIVEDWFVTEYERNRTLQAKLKCDCGKEFKLWTHEWEGKKKLRDCGCGLSAMDGQTVIKCISLPFEIWRGAKVYADSRGLKISKAVSDFIREGLDRRKGESNGEG